MDEEVKKAYLSWAEKGSCRIYTGDVFSTFYEVDQALLECERQLNKAGTGTGYSTIVTRLDKLVEDRGTLYEYIWSLLDYVESKIDKPLCENFRLNATERISRIRMEEFCVDNTIGVTEMVHQAGIDILISRPKRKLTFDDFINCSGSKTTEELALSMETGGIREFSEIFVSQYEAMREAGYLDEEVTWQEYRDTFIEQGSFYHNGSTIFENFISSVLDITIVKPIIEACTGEEWITGEDLSEMERGLKAVFAAIDIITLGQAAAATELAEVGLKDGLKLLGKTVTIEFASNTAACGVGALGEALGWPMPVTMLLSFATGVTVSVSTSEILFKGIDGSTITKMDISEATIDGQALTYTDVADRLRMQGIEVEVDVTDVKINAETGVTPNAFGEAAEGVIESGKYTDSQIADIINNLKGDGFKNNPLRQAYENEVAGLKSYGEKLLSSRMPEEQVARTLNQARRDLGIKYKNATPQPLRDYIYEVNMGRYGDKLGPTYDWLVSEKGSTNMEIINSSSRPNANIDKLLSGFEEWLRRQ